METEAKHRFHFKEFIHQARFSTLSAAPSRQITTESFSFDQIKCKNFAKKTKGDGRGGGKNSIPCCQGFGRLSRTSDNSLEDSIINICKTPKRWRARKNPQNSKVLKMSHFPLTNLKHAEERRINHTPKLSLPHPQPISSCNKCKI